VLRFAIFALILGVASSGHSIARADRLVDAREIVRGDYLGPRFSPDGRDLLLTGPQLRGLFVAPLVGAAVRRLTDEPEAGVHAQWTANGAVSYRAHRAGARRDLIVLRDNTIRTHAAAPAVAFAKDDLMYAIDRTNKLVRIGSGDRFFGAVVSPDGDKVVFQGLTTGLHLYIRSTGALRYIGPGTAPAWSSDSARVAYEVTEDDGHEIVASELFLYEVARDRVLPITTTDRVIERRPSFSPTGSAIAFDDNTGGVFVGRLEVQ
jgi:hypothetical protein